MRRRWVLSGDLTPECAAVVRAVLDALSAPAGAEDTRTYGQRYHDAVQEAMRGLVAGGLLPERAGQPVKVVAHISLADLVVLDGSSALQKEWTGRVRAQWAAHRAAASVSGSDGGAWLDGDAAAAMACDAAMAPVVTGDVNVAVIEDLVRLCVDLDRLRHHTGGTGGAGQDDTHSTSDTGAVGTGQRAPSPHTTRAWEALEQADIGNAVELLSGPGGLASFLRRRQLGARLGGPSLPLDVGVSTDIPAAIRHAVILRDQQCRWTGGCDQPAAAYVVTASLVRQLTVLNVGPVCAIILIYAGVGVLVARRQPRNPVGWILLVFVLLFMLGSDAGYYAVYDYTFGHHGLPLAAAAVLVQSSWVPALALIPLVILLFPDSRLSSRRWRLVLWAYAGLWACVAVAIWIPAVTAVADHDVRLDSFGDVTSGAARAGGALSSLEYLVVGAIVLIWLSFVGHQVLSWRRAAGERRQQQKWLALGAVITIAGVVLGAAFSGGLIGQFAGLGIAALPVGIGVGILKYRLYDIDRVIRRTVAYALVTGLLAGLYAGLVLLATDVLGVNSPVAVAASRLVAAALFRGTATSATRNFRTEHTM